MATLLPSAPDQYDRSNEQQMRRTVETRLGDQDSKLSSLLTTAGAISAGQQDVTLANGVNSDIAIGYATYVRISGPTAAFSITGFAGGETGRVLVLRNTTAYAMTITNNATSTAANRILTPSGADVIIQATGNASATFVYDSTSERWVLLFDQLSINSPTFSGLTLTGRLNLAAGTTSAEPLKFQSGTNLTSASAGATEYNGTTLLFTPVGTQRGVVPGMQTYRLNAPFAGTDGTGAQSIFNVGCTLSASTVYAFELVFSLSKTAGANAHTVALAFGGTATINNILFEIMGTTAAVAAGTTAAVSIVTRASAASAVFTGSIATASTEVRFVVKGTVSINGGGTFIPQYALSAAPGGAYSTMTGSYMVIWPVSASGAATNVGTWA